MYAYMCVYIYIHIYLVYISYHQKTQISYRISLKVQALSLEDPQLCVKNSESQSIVNGH